MERPSGGAVTTDGDDIVCADLKHNHGGNKEIVLARQTVCEMKTKMSILFATTRNVTGSRAGRRPTYSVTKTVIPKTLQKVVICVSSCQRVRRPLCFYKIIYDNLYSHKNV